VRYIKVRTFLKNDVEIPEREVPVPLPQPSGSQDEIII
jgi:hypothetical protein